ncbi:MAG TPA: hypothetical protein VHV26_07240 [Rhizomicrobium sp.]|nr:hypothetical protein [Rhizomicrobium sp.]
MRFWFQVGPEWQSHNAIFHVRLITGDFLRGPVMRRKVNGKMEYRAMTAEEMEEFELNEAW